DQSGRVAHSPLTSLSSPPTSSAICWRTPNTGSRDSHSLGEVRLGIKRSPTTRRSTYRARRQISVELGT
ncbi:unnamed protein product, partial [Sphagnum tenellum]